MVTAVVDDTVFSEDGGPCEKNFGSFLHCMELLIGQMWCKQTMNSASKQTITVITERTKPRHKRNKQPREKRMNDTKRHDVNL